MKTKINLKCRLSNRRVAPAASALRHALLAMSLVLGTASATFAQTTIVVNSLVQEATTTNPGGIQNGDCTLGEAILSANSGTAVDGCYLSGSGSPYTIQLPYVQFTLSEAHNYWYGPNALPPITSNIVIEGNGATLQITDPTIVRLRFFYVGANPQATGTLGFNTPGAGQLLLHNLTLTGGRQKGGESYTASGSGGAGMGGAIFNQGILQLNAVTVNGNSAVGGSNSLLGSGGDGGGMGQDASSSSGGGFGGSVSPAGGQGGSQGGGGGGFGSTQNGQTGTQGAAGGGTEDGLGGTGGESSSFNKATGAGSGSGGKCSNVYDGTPGAGGGFGHGGSGCGGGGVGGGGGFNSVNTGLAGGGGFGGGGGGAVSGGFGGGTDDTETTSYGGSSRGSGAGMGGAIFNHGGTLGLLNSTLTQNTATGGGGGVTEGGASGFGGAIFNLNGAVTTEFSTLAANTVAPGYSPGTANSAAGGAVYSVAYNLQTGQSATLTLSNSILSNTTGGTDLVVDQPSNLSSASGGGANAAVASLAYAGANIVMSSSVTGATAQGASPLTSDPQLAPLAIYQPGLTETMAFPSTSPALDAAVCDPNVPTDQRGVTRPQGKSCDIGAYEATYSSQTITFDSISSQVQGSALSLTGTASSGLPLTFTSTTPIYCSVSGSTATMLNGGACSIQASQGGNWQYHPATPVTQSFTILKTQTITFNSIPAQTVGASVTLKATSDSGSGIPITFTSLTTSVCTVSGNTATLIATGTCSVQASEAGSSLYAAATSVTQSFTVTLETQTITFTGLPSTATYGSAGPYTLNATASSGLTVTYSVTGPASINGSTLTITGVGTVIVTASQAGNTNYSAAASVGQTITVSAASQTITFTGLPSTASYGSAGPYTLDATASSGLTVTYTVTGPASINGSTLTITGVGMVVVTASQAGNTSYSAAASVSQTITVSAASQTITFTSLPNTATYGSAGPYTLNATASSGLAVTYTVTGPASINGSTLTITGGGTVVVTASQAGNANYSAAASVSQTITVSAVGQTITFTGLPSTATFGSAGPYKLNATASSGLAVTYSVTGPASISGSSLTITGVGTVVVTAAQAGNANYSAAASVSQTITVSAANQTITFGTMAAQTVGATVSLTASASSGLPVSFASLTSSVCTVSGTAATMIGAGTCSIQASQAGNTDYQAAAPVTESFTVNPESSFTITPVLSVETVFRGETLGGYVLELKSVNNFKGSVKLSCSTSISSPVCIDFPTTVNLSGAAVAATGILFPASAAPGKYAITFTGVSGSLTETATATLTVK
jgi:hypothetical protein